MVAYEKYNNGEMSDYIPTDEDLAAALPEFRSSREMKPDLNIYKAGQQGCRIGDRKITGAAVLLCRGCLSL